MKPLVVFTSLCLATQLGNTASLRVFDSVFNAPLLLTCFFLHHSVWRRLVTSLLSRWVENESFSQCWWCLGWWGVLLIHVLFLSNPFSKGQTPQCRQRGLRSGYIPTLTEKKRVYSVYPRIPSTTSICLSTLACVKRGQSLISSLPAESDQGLSR